MLKPLFICSTFLLVSGSVYAQNIAAREIREIAEAIIKQGSPVGKTKVEIESILMKELKSNPERYGLSKANLPAEKSLILVKNDRVMFELLSDASRIFKVNVDNQIDNILSRNSDILLEAVAMRERNLPLNLMLKQTEQTGLGRNVSLAIKDFATYSDISQTMTAKENAIIFKEIFEGSKVLGKLSTGDKSLITLSKQFTTNSLIISKTSNQSFMGNMKNVTKESGVNFELNAEIAYHVGRVVTEFDLKTVEHVRSALFLQTEKISKLTIKQANTQVRRMVDLGVYAKEMRPFQESKVTMMVETITDDLHVTWRKNFLKLKGADAVNEKPVPGNALLFEESVEEGAKRLTKNGYAKVRVNDEGKLVQDINVNPEQLIPELAHKLNGALAEDYAPLMLRLDLATKEEVESAADEIHKIWMKHNEWQKNDRPELFVAYKDLTAEEKLKDVAVLESVLKTARPEILEAKALKSYRKSLEGL